MVAVVDRVVAAVVLAVLLEALVVLLAAVEALEVTVEHSLEVVMAQEGLCALCGPVQLDNFHQPMLVNFRRNHEPLY
jgi:hypothetical protein